MRRLFFVLLAIGALASLPFGYQIQVKKRQAKEVITPSYTPKTWSAFTQKERLNMLLEGFGMETVAELPALHPPPGGLSISRYLGLCSSVDVARSLQISYGTAHHHFLYRDVAAGPLPKADLYLCWDYFTPLPSPLVLASLSQLQRSGARFLLLRHDPTLDKNSPLQGINWTLPPYNFPEPIIEIREVGKRETLALWKIDSLGL